MWQVAGTVSEVTIGRGQMYEKWILHTCGDPLASEGLLERITPFGLHHIQMIHMIRPIGRPRQGQWGMPESTSV